ncbi:MAG: type II toxin-antitoxin system RelE/ParE family toxin [Deltaproteobacteria bacterium]|nr:type II toxin-antitoxin system RelE/ParE family toxin [Deltaproteobacteria bacterium]
MTKLVIAKHARSDLDEIWFYIAQDSIDAADSVISRLLDKFTLLASQPLIGRERPEIAAGIRSFAVNAYVVFYRYADGAVEIARVIHGARDIERVI